MKREKMIPIGIAVLTLAILTIGYEYYVSLWSKNEIGAIIRVDIFIIYPIIIAISAFAFWMSKKFVKNTKTKKD